MRININLLIFGGPSFDWSVILLVYHVKNNMYTSL